MFREPIYEFIKQGEQRLYLPKNTGLNAYVSGVLLKAGLKISKERLSSKKQPLKTDDGLELVLCRGEDVPQRVAKQLGIGKKAVGITGDDLYDEYKLRNPDSAASLEARNTYDWLDQNALFGAPALCLIARTDSLDGIKDTPTIAITEKYKATAKRALNAIFANRSGFTMFLTKGDTESYVSEGVADACIDIVYSGNSLQRYGLVLVGDPIRRSDIVLIGEKTPTNIFATEAAEIANRKQNPTSSLTSRLLRDENEATKKFGSETAEFLRAFLTNEQMPLEATDVIYAMQVMLAAKGIEWSEVEAMAMTKRK